MHPGMICLGLWSKTKNTFTSSYTLGNVGHNLSVHKDVLMWASVLVIMHVLAEQMVSKGLSAFDVWQKILSVLTPFYNHVPYVLLCPGNPFLFWPTLHSLFNTWLISNCVRKERECTFKVMQTNRTTNKHTDTLKLSQSNSIASVLFYQNDWSSVHD